MAVSVRALTFSSSVLRWNFVSNKSDSRLLNVVEMGPNTQQLRMEKRERNELREAGMCMQSSSSLRETGRALGPCSTEDHRKLESLGMTPGLMTCSTGCCDTKRIPKREGFSPTKWI